MASFPFLYAIYVVKRAVIFGKKSISERNLDLIGGTSFGMKNVKDGRAISPSAVYH